MYCPMCGIANDEEAKFCKGCGHKLFGISPKIKTEKVEVETDFREEDFKTLKQESKIKKLSKPAFLVLIGLGFGIGYLLFGIGYLLLGSGLILSFAEDIENGAYFLKFSLIPLLFGGIILCILIYRMWDSIPEKFARTTPGKAVGLIFVPFFNFYWIFQAIWGFSKDYNKFVSQYRPDAPRLSEGLFLAYPILTLVSIPFSWIPGINIFLYIGTLVIILILVNGVCNAVNYLAELER